ncbi:M20 family peptidase [Actinobacteria bacterium YIM 96077]|uniref:Peptidase M20 dimerisation domain-containing protein n=1 Tax=Phytoactinopolyspora halophila TaxID=1981511 RepID=A0A329QQ05_9ACTN|nr:M20 family metallopeptidase [Phytoactinopolyspora halophila]AYY12274.1 M20 family peptidase [Actinobacteria bacterium YIM 96077]RAW13809.1 hypothetical protein DPM12_12465 [Phytoactinopolyspora halophila]
MTIQSIDVEQVSATTQDLVTYPSVNPPGDVRAITEYIAGRFETAGWRVSEMAGDPEKPNLVIEYGPDDERPAALLFYAHSDVVGVDDNERPLWVCDPFDGYRDGDTLYGRGTVDAKSKIAALVAAAGAVAASGIPATRKVRVIIEADGERGDQLGIKYMKDQDERVLLSDMMLACEPSENKVLRVYKGRLWMRLSMNLPNVHSLVPETGTNAIERLINVLPRILGADLTESPLDDPDLAGEMMGSESRCYTQLHAGHAYNISPGSAEATVDVRPVPGQTIDQVVADFRRVVDEVNAERPDAPVILDPMAESFREPAVVERTSPVIRAVQKAYLEGVGRPVEFGTGYSVGGLQHFWDLGIPGIYFGSGGIWDAHSANEKVTLPELHDMTSAYTQLMYNGLLDRLTGTSPG